MNDYRQSHLDKGNTYDDSLENDFFSSYITKRHFEILEKETQRLFPSGIDNYLDFACGTGRITQCVSPKSSHSFGVDVSETMLTQAKEKSPNTTFFQCDLTKDEIDIPTIDLVTAFRFFGNAENELRRNVLQEISKLLRPGGYFITNNHRNPLAIQILLNRITGGSSDVDLSYSKFKNLLSENGLHIVRSHSIGFWMFRHSMIRLAKNNSNWINLSERLFQGSLFCQFSPDYILVIQKEK